MNAENLVVHKSADYHCAFPHIIRLRNGDLVTLFREAPIHLGTSRTGNWIHGKSHFHRDPGSRNGLVRSTDDGRTWDPDSHVMVYASDEVHDVNMGMISELPSGELMINTMHFIVDPPEEQFAELRTRRTHSNATDRRFGVSVFDSLLFTRSADQGRTWSEPEAVYLPSLDYDSHSGKNGLVVLPDGTWLLPMHGSSAAGESERSFVVRSNDQGLTWGQPSMIAHDLKGKIQFSEPAVALLPSGRLLAMMRSDDYLNQAFSTDGGWVWQGLKRTPMWGFPPHLLPLKDGRVLCTYGYRREPFGVRAVLSSDDGETWDIDNEIIIRGDGLHRDLGYPASIQRQDGSILSIYYFSGEDGIRHIAGTIHTV